MELPERLSTWGQERVRHGFANAGLNRVTRQARRKDIEESLRAAEDRYRYTIAVSPLIPWIGNHKGEIIDIDVRGLDYTGLSYGECMGLGFLAAIHPSDQTTVQSLWRRAKLTGQPLDYEMRLRDRGRSYRWQRVRAVPRTGTNGSVFCWYGTIEDIHERKVVDQDIRWAADHDGLTGLWNRRAFMRGFEASLKLAKDSGVEVALALIDLDQFKSLNDQNGHSVGDAILRQAAERLNAINAGDCMPARLGGDEFAFLIFVLDYEQLRQQLDALCQTLASPYVIGGQTHLCRASIGVALYLDQASDVESVYQDADLALYEAKRAGNGLCIFETSMRDALETRLSQLATARQALADDRIGPFYQPKVDLASGEVKGFEALLRWVDDAGDINSPVFIQAALEDAELSIALDNRMFEMIARDISKWITDDVPFGRIAFNVSAAEIKRDGFAARLLARIDRFGIPATALELEVTETVLMDRTSNWIVDVLTQLRAAGLTIALDDFGTGYASLVHLKHFPIDVLKIDRSFTLSLDDPADAAIVNAIIELGRNLGKAVVAEGIETADQANRLFRRGCELGQGYLFSAAVPAEQVPGILLEMQKCWQPVERRLGKDRRAE